MKHSRVLFRALLGSIIGPGWTNPARVGSNTSGRNARFARPSKCRSPKPDNQCWTGFLGGKPTWCRRRVQAYRALFYQQITLDKSRGVVFSGITIVKEG